MAPHSKIYYSAAAIFAFSFGLLFSFGVVRAMTFSMSDVFFAAIPIILLLGGLQALERLLRPERAIRRSRAFSASTRRRLRIIGNVSGISWYAALALGFVVRLFGSGGFVRDAATYFGIFAFPFFLVGLCLADLAGEKFPGSATQPIGT